MPTRTTLAETLTHIFERLEENMPPAAGRLVTLLEAWSNTLGPNRNALDVVTAIGQICSVLIKLEAQVQASKKLTSVHKHAAMQTISGFRALFEVQRFGESCTGFRVNVQADRRGNLGLIGHSLESEFSEPRLEKADADDLAAILTEVKELLGDSSIALDLRLSLMRHVDTMLWWLAHPEMASMQDIFETVGSAMVVAKQIEDRDAERGSDTPSSGILERVSAFAAKCARLIGFTVRGIEAADRLTNDISNLYQSITPPS
jgi:hypothetical protein